MLNCDAVANNSATYYNILTECHAIMKAVLNIANEKISKEYVVHDKYTL